MNKKNIKIIIIASILSWGINPLLIFFYTAITFFYKIELEAPITAYFIYGNFPLFVAGSYIAYSKTTSRVPICISVSILYVFYKILLNNIYSIDQIVGDSGLNLVELINVAIRNILIIIGSCAIVEYIRGNFLTRHSR